MLVGCELHLSAFLLLLSEKTNITVRRFMKCPFLYQENIQPAGKPIGKHLSEQKKHTHLRTVSYLSLYQGRDLKPLMAMRCDNVYSHNPVVRLAGNFGAIHYYAPLPAGSSAVLQVSLIERYTHSGYYPAVSERSASAAVSVEYRNSRVFRW